MARLRRLLRASDLRSRLHRLSPPGTRRVLRRVRREQTLLRVPDGRTRRAMTSFIAHDGTTWPLRPHEAAKARGRVSVVGLGIRLPADLTVQAMETLSAAAVVYTLEPRAWYAEALAPVAAKIVDLSPLFFQYPFRDDAL